MSNVFISLPYINDVYALNTKNLVRLKKMSNHSAKKHYENLLAKHYSWMFGDFDEQVEKNQTWFSRQNILPGSNRNALDLGCGSGFQSLALAALGFDVTAVDFNNDLLEELKLRDKNQSVKIIQSDILEPENYATGFQFELVVCMGDTLTHLSKLQSVSHFIENSYHLLEPNGKLILSFRDLSVELEGTDRFIPVQSDPDKIMTAFLEYETDHVNVHDIIYTRENESWNLEKSVYKKLRLSANQVKDILTKNSFYINSIEKDRGMVYIIAIKE